MNANTAQVALIQDYMAHPVCLVPSTPSLGNATEVWGLLCQALRLIESMRDHSSILPMVPMPPSLKDIERASIVEALEKHRWIQKDAAKSLGISPRVMTYKVQAMDIDVPGRSARKRRVPAS
jgi:transcriptional regulator with GAF, ATPase, and Fis domain